MDGFRSIRAVVAEILPGSAWWLWGELCTAAEVPRFDPPSTNAVALLRVTSSTRPSALTTAVEVVRRSQAWDVDASLVVDSLPGHPGFVEASLTLEKYRDRARTWVWRDDSAHVGFAMVLP